MGELLFDMSEGGTRIDERLFVLFSALDGCFLLVLELLVLSGGVDAEHDDCCKCEDAYHEH